MLPADSPLDITEFKILNSATGQVETVSVPGLCPGSGGSGTALYLPCRGDEGPGSAAHTWALHCALTQRENPDPALKGADFSADPDHLKGYARAEDIKATYGNMADEYWDKITTAADSVMDYVLLYDGEPIQAVYHSCSIGVTESAENVWQASVPYLVPVESEGDLVAPAAEAEVTFTSAEMRALLTAAFDGLVLGDNPALWALAGELYRIGLHHGHQGGQPHRHRQGGAAALDLRSASFAISYDSAEDLFTIHTQGYGHGVGLSQYGADYMARQGADFKETSPITTPAWNWLSWTDPLPPKYRKSRRTRPGNCSRLPCPAALFMRRAQMPRIQKHPAWRSSSVSQASISRNSRSKQAASLSSASCRISAQS